MSLLGKEEGRCQNPWHDIISRLEGLWLAPVSKGGTGDGDARQHACVDP